VLFTDTGQDLDTAGYHAIHDAYRPPWLTTTMQATSKLGETKSALYGLCFFAFFGTPAGQVTAKLAAVSVLASGLVAGGLKWITQRERPEAMEEHRHNTSFPSQHASGAAAVAFLLARRHPRLAWPALAFALLMGLSRIYLGRHFPTDVLTGFILGAISSWLVLRGERRIARLHL
jgi:membrane-associated phospholipid phosphatase